MNLRVDPDRAGALHEHTGIYVRAQRPDGKWDNADIAELGKDSLRAWLRSRGGDNPWAEDVVAILLGHGHFEKEIADETSGSRSTT